jgi:L-aspartate oxidase
MESGSKKKVIVVGGGLSGSLAVLHAQKFADVTLLTKAGLHSSNSYLAQGGIAVVMPENTPDNHQSHIEDTLNAGVHLNNTDSVEALIGEGTQEIQWLRSLGMAFDTHPDGNLMFNLESAHSFPRVIHAGGDSTGKHILEFVQSKVLDAVNTPDKRVRIVENAFVSELLVSRDGQRRIYGVRYLDADDTEYIAYADYVILATGGVGNIYSLTSNDTSVQGDGIALAMRAGAELERMEYMQFHPTLLDLPAADANQPHALVTEAVRGAGGVLINELGDAFMKGVHPGGDLAPRDVVARAIYAQIQAGHKIYLDISNITDFDARFPTATANINAAEIDVSGGRIPVTPGAHFFMGGVKTNQNGATNIEHLYAVGEVASTRVHGANRLASNSLLECIVFAKRVAETIENDTSLPLEMYPGVVKSTSQEVKVPELKELRERAWESIGIVRNRSKLLEFIKYTAEFDTQKIVPSKEQMVLENMVLAARQIAGAALKNTTSIGAHYLEEQPQERDI